ncbi:MAG TPA: hypothetical protein VK201_10345, partial [bacterium]|nr:hypothetical protein [bacterium]
PQAEAAARPGPLALRQRPAIQRNDGKSLIDLYRLMVHPIVAGKGKRLFAEGVSQSNLELTEAKRFKTGIAVLELVPAKAA